MPIWIRFTACIALLLLFSAMGRGIVPGLCANLVIDYAAVSDNAERAAIKGSCCVAAIPDCCRGAKQQNNAGEPAPGKSKPCPFCALVCIPCETVQLVQLDITPPVAIGVRGESVHAPFSKSLRGATSPRAPPILCM